MTLTECYADEFSCNEFKGIDDWAYGNAWRFRCHVPHDRGYFGLAPPDVTEIGSSELQGARLRAAGAEKLGRSTPDTVVGYEALVRGHRADGLAAGVIRRKDTGKSLLARVRLDPRDDPGSGRYATASRLLFVDAPVDALDDG